MTDPLEPLRAHFSGLWLRADSPYGQVYAGRDVTGAEVTVAVLSVTAAADPRLRDGFADVVWRHSIGTAPGRATVYSADLHAAQPWAAARNTAWEPGAEQLFEGLAEVVAAGPASASTAQPAVVPPPPAFPPPRGGVPAAGYPPPAGVGKRGQLPVLLGVAGAVFVVLMLVVGAVVVQQLRPDGGTPVAVAPTGATDPPAASSAEPSPIGGVAQQPSGKPTLRPVEPESVIGPTFARADETYTMAFQGWPFAFRTPLPWNCRAGSWEAVPQAEVWSCRGEAGSGQRVDVMLWECSTTCTAAEQTEMIDTWLDEPAEAVKAAAPTYYVETERNGVYSVDLGHFATDPVGGELRWLVGIYAESSAEDNDDVLKIMNDIIGQAG